MVSEKQSTPSVTTASGAAIPQLRDAAAGLRDPAAWRPFRLFETVTDLDAGAKTLRRRSYGVIEVREGRLRRIRLRPYPKLVSLYELGVASLLHGRRSTQDRCLLYYNAPWRCPGYIALRYLISDRGASIKTVNTALRTLDEIADLRRALAIVCDAANPRLSPRLMERYGWVRHCDHLRGRHYIKRYAR